MALGIAFWVIYLVFVILCFPGNTLLGDRGPLGNWIIGALLFGLLGYAVFGAMIHR
jgi:hypothetical protein